MTTPEHLTAYEAGIWDSGHNRDLLQIISDLRGEVRKLQDLSHVASAIPFVDALECREAKYRQERDAARREVETCIAALDEARSEIALLTEERDTARGIAAGYRERAGGSNGRTAP